MAIYKILAINVPLVFHQLRRWGRDENKKPRYSIEYQGFLVSRDDWIRTSDNTPPRRVL